MISRLACSRLCLAGGTALVLLSLPLMAGIGPYIAIAGMLALAAGAALVPRRRDRMDH